MTEEARDPYLWLEDVLGEQQLNWVRTRNDPTVAQFAGEEFERMRAEALEVLDTDARIPYVRRRGEYLYNFWRDAANPRGLWRRTTLDSYRGDTTEWDVLLDFDELSRADNENWVWSGAIVIEPEFTRALVNLSRGGADAVVVREFDMQTREFIADGFELPEAKTQIGWDDPDTVLVGTDFGPESLTESGYPRIVKRWHRGTPLDDAELIFEGARTDVSAGGSTDRTPGFERTFVSRSTDFWNSERYELRGSELVHIDVPSDASSISIHREWLLIEPRTDWTFGTTTYPAGSLLATKYEEFISGAREFTVVFEPDAHTCLHQYAWTRDRLLLVTLVDVASRVEIVTPGSWDRAPLPGIPAATESVIVAADETGDEFFLDSSGFDSPSRLLRGTGGDPLRADQSRAGLLRRRKPHRAAAFRDIERRHQDTRISLFDPARSTGPPRPCCTATADSRTPTPLVTARSWAGSGWPAVEPTCWPTSAAEVSTGRAGTPRRCAKGVTWSPKTSPRWQPIWWTAASQKCRSSARRAAATADC